MRSTIVCVESDPVDNGRKKHSPDCNPGIPCASRNDSTAATRELESIRERALEVLAHYKKNKTVIRREVRKEYASAIRHLEKERAQRESIIKDKMLMIDELEARIESLDNEVFGLRSRSKLWEHECARISDVYHRTVLYYSNPGLVEVQLQVISEYTDALIRFVRAHKWDKDTVIMAQRYCDSLYTKLRDLVRDITINPLEDTSLASARKHTDAAPLDGETKK